MGYLLRELSEEEYAKLIYLRYTLEKGVVQWIIDHCSDTEIDSLPGILPGHRRGLSGICGDQL